MRANRIKFQKNEAYYTGGAIYVSSFSWMEVILGQFTENKAPYSSAIEIIMGSKQYNSSLYDCLFKYNKAIRNTISVREANMIVNKSRLYENDA